MIRVFDAFSGIGGFRSAFEKVGGFKMVGWCEIDSMAGIDEMNVLSGDSDSSSGAESGVDYSALDTSEPVLPDWAERLKSSMKNGDWSGVGAILAERVSAALSDINWDGVQQNVNGVIGNITDGISGFINTLDWNAVGDTLAGGINTAFGAIYTFFDGIDWAKLGKNLSKGLNQTVKKTDWKLIGKTIGKYVQSLVDVLYSFVTGTDFGALGKSLGDSLNSLFESVDFGKLGETLSEAVKGILDFLIDFVQTTDWRQIGNKIAEFVSNIDWAGIASKAFELLGSAIGGAVSLVWGFIEDAVSDIGSYFSEKIEECGGNFSEGLYKGIKDALKNVGKWINDNIFKPFIDGFKKCFGINSPSKVMAEMGDFIIEGLCNAISDGIRKVDEIFGEILKTIKDIFKNIGGWFKDRFTEAWDNIKSVFSMTALKNWFTCRWSDIKAIFAGVGTWFSDKFQKAYDGITGIFGELGEFFSGIWDGISDDAKTGLNWIIDHLNGLLGKIESAVNSIVSALNSISVDIPNWVPGIGGNSFGINIPSVNIPEIPKLAEGGFATAPTLALIGDNKNARVDPEVVAPLSKLEGMTGGNSEIIGLLRLIVELLKGGMNIEIINYLFKGSREFSREVVNAIADENARRGGL